jgi:GAF domain-containing protein
MFDHAKIPTKIPELRECLGQILRTALSITGDMGNVQLVDPVHGSLRIVSQIGFHRPFLNFFSTTHEGLAACGTAMSLGKRVIVEDVASDPIFSHTETRNVMLAARARAVQSTPLLKRSGKILGIISTHYNRSGRPSGWDLGKIDKLAGSAARLIEHELSAQTVKNPYVETWDQGGDYALFCRTKAQAIFVETMDNLEKGLERLEELSLTEAGEFVLFSKMNVVAASKDGVVRRLDPFSERA